MNIFIYSDESGVFDRLHNQYFVFAGLIFLSKESRDAAERKYKNVERKLMQSSEYSCDCELKANILSNKHKSSIFRSLNGEYKFAVIIDQNRVHEEIFKEKKTKQRYLDFAYKIAIKKALQSLMNRDIIQAKEVENIYFFVDEHTTATDGRYELRESLEQELKFGTYNWNFSIKFPPLFPDVKTVDLSFCNSSKKALIRAADIIANNIYHKALTGSEIVTPNINIIQLP